MGSDPLYVKFPRLSLAQNIFQLTNPASAKEERHEALELLQNAISEQKMAPLYRYLAHPTEGVLNEIGEGTSQVILSNSKKPSPAASLITSRKSAHKVTFPWDEKLYEKLKAENVEELEAIQKEEDDATEKAGDTEIQAARGKRAEFWARVGDKVNCLAED
jgi:26S proteasome regulatory subunit N7